ncbi:MAG: ABC transporter permease [Eubacteriales bacterium]|nr:ABC transporter permease [Eubacteriales bacterium]
MKTFRIWTWLLTKRLFHKPMFVLTLMLIPAFVLLLQFSIQSGDAMLRVALYTENADVNSSEGRLLSQLVEDSQHSIQFYLCDTLADLQSDVHNHRAACGYVIPAGLEEKLQQHETSATSIITAYHPKGAIETLLIDEILYSKIYRELAYDIAYRHICEKTKQNPDHLLRTRYDQYHQDYSFIQFEYADGTQNQILNQADTNYMLLPVRGIVSILILLAAMTGTIFWYGDHAHHVFLRLTGYQQTMVKLLYSLIPAVLAGIIGFAAILLTGFAGPILQECIAMGLLFTGACAYCMLLRELLRNQAFYLSAIPISVTGSILLCPVFVDLTSHLPFLKPLQMLSPVYYYLRSIYSVQARWEYILYTSILLFLTFCLHALLQKKQASDHPHILRKFLKKRKASIDRT